MPLYTPAASSNLVAAAYSTNAGQTISAGNTDIIDFGTKIMDSNSAVTTGSGWKFVAPSAGTYMVMATITFLNNPIAIDTAIPVMAYVNGSFVRALSQDRLQNGMSLSLDFSGRVPVVLAANDELNIRITNNDDSSQSLSSGSGLNHVTIFKITSVTT